MAKDKEALGKTRSLILISLSKKQRVSKIQTITK